MNKKRRAIFNKSNGHCWYCGCKLEKGWHADHLEPVVRNLATNEMEQPQNDTFDNLVPSCPSCNIQKSSLELESWRRIIKGHIKSLNRDSTQYKIAKRFGLVQETDREVVFWFEREENNEQSTNTTNARVPTINGNRS